MLNLKTWFSYYKRFYTVKLSNANLALSVDRLTLGIQKCLPRLFASRVVIVKSNARNSEQETEAGS